MNKIKGFTLVELLAVIVILAIILAVAVPGISNVIENSSKVSFNNDAKLVLKAVDLKKLEDETFDISIIGKDNIEQLLNISAENYSSVDVLEVDNNLYVKLVGQGKWEGMTACGIYKNMRVTTSDDCSTDFNSPVITYSPNGSSTYIKSSTVNVTVYDDNVDEATLKYVWTGSGTKPTSDGYITSFSSGTNISMPNENGIFYLHVIAGDVDGNIATAVREFRLDNERPVLTLVGNNPVYHPLGATYSDAGATATDNTDSAITSKVAVTGTINPNAIGTYTLTYNVSDEAGNAATSITRTVNVVQATYSYSYTGNSQTFNAPHTGKYKFEVWGAQGGNFDDYLGKGGYSVGEFNMTSGQNIYIYVGGKGNATGYMGDSTGGWNGGGNGGRMYGAGGGGGTDMRFGGTGLNNRVIVAGGGGGDFGSDGDGHGGGINGIDSNEVDTNSGTTFYGGKGGTQTAGGAGGLITNPFSPSEMSAGNPGTLGQGGHAPFPSVGGGYAGGGGGGYYGGGSGSDSYYYGGASGGGGSGYIGGVTNGQTIAPNNSMPDPAGGTMSGRKGHGYARITYVGQ